MAEALAFLARARALGAEAADALPPDAIRLYDPVPMRLARRADRERAQLLVESVARPRLQAFLSGWVARLPELRPARTLRWHVDVDPIEL